MAGYGAYNQVQNNLYKRLIFKEFFLHLQPRIVGLNN